MVGHFVGIKPVASEEECRKSILCSILAAGLALAVAGEVEPAPAAPFFGPFDSGPRFGPYHGGSPYVQPNPAPRVGPSYAPRLRSNRAGTRTGQSRESTKAPAPDVPKGTLQIVVSIGEQRVTLYSNGNRVAQSAVSTGVPGHPTPMGVFSVIQRDRYHHSNLYSNAPMPYMQRITWSGVAMHEGPLPGHPASHGCIRLTHDFAARLWVTTKLGARVFVLRNDMAPHDFTHPKLFEPQQKPVEVSASQPSDDLRPALADLESGAGAGRGPFVMAQAATGETGTGEPDGVGEHRAGSYATDPAAVRQATPVAPSPAAVEPARSDEPKKPEPVMTEPFKPLPARSRTAEPGKHSGQVAVFVSRKEKKVFVRQGFEPLFDMPVEIAHPEEALGTHVFTALELLDGGAHMRWNVLSIASAEPRRTVVRETRKGGRRVELPVREVAEAKSPISAAQVLDRITLPQEAIDRISELLVPGSSLVISDAGLGGETGRSTEFIVVTH